MRRVLLLAAMAFLTCSGLKAEEVIGHFRSRPPEMIKDGDKFDGPLLAVIGEAVEPLGLAIKWQEVPFPRSLKDMEQGLAVIVPRVNRLPDREAYAVFLGPISVQKRKIKFAVRAGEENHIKSYADLTGLKIGVKRATTYFSQFDGDAKLDKKETVDDRNLVVQLLAGRLDAAIVIDVGAFNAAALQAKAEGLAWAAWQVDMEQPNYYAIGKTSPLASRAGEIDARLKAMIANGRVAAIYARYNVDPETVE